MKQNTESNSHKLEEEEEILRFCAFVESKKAFVCDIRDMREMKLRRMRGFTSCMFWVKFLEVRLVL